MKKINALMAQIDEMEDLLIEQVVNVNFDDCDFDRIIDEKNGRCTLTITEHDQDNEVLFHCYFELAAGDGERSAEELLMKLLTTPVIFDGYETRRHIAVYAIWQTADGHIRVVPMTTWVDRDTLDWSGSDEEPGREDGQLERY